MEIMKEFLNISVDMEIKHKAIKIIKINIFLHNKSLHFAINNSQNSIYLSFT